MIKKLFNKLFNSPKTAISFKQGLDLTELPVVTLYQEDNKFNLILDTGSTDNIIDSNILDKIKHTPLNKETSLFGLEGDKKVVPICGIELSYEGNKYDYYYLIKDMSGPFNEIKATTGVTLHGIIGSMFFNKFKYVLDFDKLIAYSKL